MWVYELTEIVYKSGTYEIQDHIETEEQQPWGEYPQVRKKGVAAVHEKLPTEGHIIKKKCYL